MTKITIKPFDEQMQLVLSDITDTYHAGELSSKPLAELPEHIHIIEVNDVMVGYAVIWEYAKGKQLINKAETDYFNVDEKYLHKEFYSEISNKSNFIFIEALDVMKDYEGKGYAAFFIKWLKENYPKKKMYVYTLEKTKNFWYKQDFDVIGTTEWMSFN